MRKPVPLTPTLPSPRELTVSRTFSAPRALVFEAFATPEMVKRWLFGPDEWPMVECSIDFRVGGAFRYVWRGKTGQIGDSGVFREIVDGERIVHTETFDIDWTGGETLVTIIFAQAAGATTVTTTVRYASEAARDKTLKTDMLQGWGQTYDRLADYLETLNKK